MATGLLSNGVAVGWYNDGSGYGILTRNTNAVSFLGTATAPVWWVRCNTVQESGGSTAWPGHGAAGGLVGADTGNISQSPQARKAFSLKRSGLGGYPVAAAPPVLFTASGATAGSLRIRRMAGHTVA